MIHVDVWQKPTQYCKAIILQLKRKKKRHWSRLPFPPPGNFPDPGIKPHLLWQVDLGIPLEKVKAIPSHPWDETRRGEGTKKNKVVSSIQFLPQKKQVKTLPILLAPT